MKTFLKLQFIILFVIGLSPAMRAQEPDIEGSKDHSLFNRLPNFYIHVYDEKEFDSHEFIVNHDRIPVEGHYWRITYYLQSGKTEPSSLQIVRNYENAIKKIGGTVLTSNYDGSSYMKVVNGDKEVWVEVNGGIGSEYHLYIIEKEAMKQDIVATAEAMKGDIGSTGHTAIYGFYFDFGKSDPKPESDAALKEITTLLKNDPSLKLNIVGHTDNVGSMDANMKLSQARADAVAKALSTKYGIAADRLKGYGAGPLCPVTSNDTEEGRAKNRRVELVKR